MFNFVQIVWNSRIKHIAVGIQSGISTPFAPITEALVPTSVAFSTIPWHWHYIKKL